MQRLLNPNEAAKISERLHDNALLLTCQQVWPERQEVIVSVTACPVDIFCEAAWLMDELIDADDDIDIMSMVHGLWTKVVSDISSWNSNGVSLPDRYLIVSTIFRIVATSLSLHWQAHYCDILRDALLMVIDEKRPEPANLHEHQQQEKQQQDLFAAIIPCSTILNEWVNEYIDNPNYWLTDEIDNVLNPPRNIKTGKTESRKADKKPIIRKRMTWKGNEITHSFSYVAKSMPTEEKNKRLSTAFNLLNRKYISHTEMTTFINIFSGVETSEYIVWRGYIVELQYFIESLIVKGLITWRRPAPGKWQIVCARFRLEHDVVEEDAETNLKQPSKIIDTLEPSQFNKIPKANKLKKHEILDKIISILVEESDSMKINRELIEMFAHLEMSEKDTQNGQSQVRKVDY